MAGDDRSGWYEQSPQGNRMKVTPDGNTLRMFQQDI
jgi:hypothetical protein